MLKKLAIVGGVFVLVIAAILLYAATKPNDFTIQRSASIQAAPEKVFPHVNDFHNWRAWSPWEKLDPELKRTYSGAESGKGAVYEWQGNDNVGSGRMEIVEVAQPNKLDIKLDFFKPFEAHNSAIFTFEPKGESTDVSWTMRGESPFMMKVMCIFVDMDKMIGKDFEAGLASLKAIAEKEE